MNIYYLSWTYIANYSDRPIAIGAESPQAAIDKLCAGYSPEFKEKATISVYEAPPCFVQVRGQNKTPTA